MVYNVMIESGFKQEMNFQMYAAMKNNIFRIIPHKLSVCTYQSACQQFLLTRRAARHTWSALGSSQLPNTP